VCAGGGVYAFVIWLSFAKQKMSLTESPVAIDGRAGHGALVWNVAPVEPPHNLRGGDSHGSTVDDESEILKVHLNETCFLCLTVSYNTMQHIYDRSQLWSHAG
jgi:hypothetical protein